MARATELKIFSWLVSTRFWRTRQSSRSQRAASQTFNAGSVSTLLVIDLTTGLMPVVLVSAVRVTLALPDFVCTLADSILVLVRHAALPVGGRLRPNHRTLQALSAVSVV